MDELSVVLKQEQVDFFGREGYLALPAITTAAEVERMRRIYDDLFASDAGRAVGDQFDLAGTNEDDQPAALPQIVNVSKYAPELAQSLYRLNAAAIARQLLGPAAEFLGDHAIRKPAHTGADTPWHQDEAYWEPELEHEAISFWMPLQETTVEHGCMQFIPGSFKLDVLPHHSIGHDPRVHGLEADEVDVARAVACPLPAGGATIHHCRTLHYAGPNLTAEPRRAYILVFGNRARPREKPRQFVWQEMWQTTRKKKQ